MCRQSRLSSCFWKHDPWHCSFKMVIRRSKDKAEQHDLDLQKVRRLHMTESRNATQHFIYPISGSRPQKHSHHGTEYTIGLLFMGATRTNTQHRCKHKQWCSKQMSALTTPSDGNMEQDSIEVHQVSLSINIMDKSWMHMDQAGKHPLNSCHASSVLCIMYYKLCTCHTISFHNRAKGITKRKSAMWNRKQNGSFA